MSHSPSDRPGYFFVIAAALLWAASGNAAKFLLQGGLSPFHLVQLRTVIAAFLLFLLLFFLRRDLLKIEVRDLPYFVLLGAILAVMLFSYLYAVSSIPIAAAVLLQYQAPAVIVLYSFFFRREKVPALTFLALLSALIGCYFMVGAHTLALSGMKRSGILAGLASAAALAFYSLRSDYGMKRYSAWTVLFYALATAAVIWNSATPPFGAFAALSGASDWLLVMGVSILGTVAPFGLYNEGIRRIDPAHASITATLEPVMAGFIAFLLFGEALDSLQMSGAALVITSIVLLQLGGGDQRQAVQKGKQAPD